MKKLLIIVLTFLALGVNAQTVDTAKAKPDTLLHLPAINKAAAKQVLEAMSLGSFFIKQAQSIPAKNGFEADAIYSAFMQLIYKKWPDLIPKQQVQTSK